MKRQFLLSIAAIVFAACADGGPIGPTVQTGIADGEPDLRVLTWNIYVGARLENLLRIEDVETIPFEVADLVGEIAATDFPARASALADQIAAVRPDVISLQEVSRFRTQSPGDFLTGNPVAASTPILDWLDILGDELAARGLSYDVAVQSQNFDIELPMVDLSTGGLADIRLTDFDVILVRKGMEWRAAASGSFQAVLPIEIGGLTIPKPSGWASVDLEVGRGTYRYFNTHLEAADLAPGVVDPGLGGLQAAQLAELRAVLAESPHPVILTGDLNSAADGTSTPAYAELLRDGFVDAWTSGKPPGAGYTSNQAPDLRNAASQLFHRIDFILVRNRVSGISGHLTGAADARLLGAEPADRTPGGLWPSDHAGVFAALHLSPGRGVR